MVKEKYDFNEKPSLDDKFEEQIVIDILNNIPYDHVETEEPYVEPTVQDAETIDDKTKQENEDYLQTLPNLIKFIWQQLHKKSNFYNDLFDAVVDLPDSRQIIGDTPTTEDILLMKICLVKMSLKMSISK